MNKNKLSRFFSLNLRIISFHILLLIGCSEKKEILTESREDQKIQSSYNFNEKKEEWQQYVSQEFFRKKTYPKTYQDLSPQPSPKKQEKPSTKKTPSFFEKLKDDPWKQYAEQEAQRLKIKRLQKK